MLESDTLKNPLPMTEPARSSIVRKVELAHATLERFQKGDPEAFAQVVRAFGPLVRGAVSRYWQSAFDREEAMQEIWMHVWKHREALDLARAASFSGWLAVLARRRCIDLLREPRDPALAGEATEAEALAWLGTAAEQESSVEGDELGEAVRLFKQKLKEPWREFFELHFERGLDYEEVCGRMGISRLRCKYMRKVLAMKARRNAKIMAALGRPEAKRDAAS